MEIISFSSFIIPAGFKVSRAIFVATNGSIQVRKFDLTRQDVST